MIVSTAVNSAVPTSISIHEPTHAWLLALASYNIPRALGLSNIMSCWNAQQWLSTMPPQSVYVRRIAMSTNTCIMNLS